MRGKLGYAKKCTDGKDKGRPCYVVAASKSGISLLVVFGTKTRNRYPDHVVISRFRREYKLLDLEHETWFYAKDHATIDADTFEPKCSPGTAMQLLFDEMVQQMDIGDLNKTYALVLPVPLSDPAPVGSAVPASLDAPSVAAAPDQADDAKG